MYTNFDEWDLEHIDYYGTSNLSRLETPKEDDDSNCERFLYSSFEFLIKDGRKFRCEQDLNHVFTIHSNKYGDVECNLWQKMAADIINDNDKFFTIVETIKNVADYAKGYSYSGHVYVRDFMVEGMAQILIPYYRAKHTTLFLELIKMGLDKDNKFVTLEPVIKP